MQKDLFFCFIDYTKAFVIGRHKAIFKLLGKLHLFGKDVKIIQNLY